MKDLGMKRLETDRLMLREIKLDDVVVEPQKP